MVASTQIVGGLSEALMTVSSLPDLSVHDPDDPILELKSQHDHLG